MKLVSWNVNGLRACVGKGFLDFFDEVGADVFCVQETKLQEGQIELHLPEYVQYWNSAVKKGYSGTAVFSKRQPVSVSLGLGIDEHDQEGRAITLDYGDFFLVNVYTPNSQDALMRLPYRMQWEDAFRDYVQKLDQSKPVILCGDLNVAHREIDLKNPKSNRHSAGFTDEEREKLTALLDSGFTDTFRFLYPDKTGAYTWWSYMNKARQNNAGWRIDYFLTSERLRGQIAQARIYSDILGSDHCPVGLELAW
jgi:exodeoxyribonuclease-3